MLTVFKTNVAALAFYGKLRYAPDADSPSVTGVEAAHEILSKVSCPRKRRRRRRGEGGGIRQSDAPMSQTSSCARPYLRPPPSPTLPAWGAGGGCAGARGGRGSVGGCGAWRRARGPLPRRGASCTADRSRWRGGRRRRGRRWGGGSGWRRGKRVQLNPHPREPPCSAPSLPHTGPGPRNANSKTVRIRLNRSCYCASGAPFIAAVALPKLVRPPNARSFSVSRPVRIPDLACPCGIPEGVIHAAARRAGASTPCLVRSARSPRNSPRDAATPLSWAEPC
jgi:hypothetical protein